MCLECSKHRLREFVNFESDGDGPSLEVSKKFDCSEIPEDETSTLN